VCHGGREVGTEHDGGRVARVVPVVGATGSVDAE
jgi:hypothetical protein